jgi:hypothetical protein
MHRERARRIESRSRPALAGDPHLEPDLPGPGRRLDEKSPGGLQPAPPEDLQVAAGLDRRPTAREVKPGVSGPPWRYVYVGDPVFAMARHVRAVERETPAVSERGIVETRGQHVTARGERRPERRLVEIELVPSRFSRRPWPRQIVVERSKDVIGTIDQVDEHCRVHALALERLQGRPLERQQQAFRISQPHER